MSGWYVKRPDKKYGPYSSTQLVEMAQKGQVLPIDWVARGHGGKWMLASEVKGLFAAPPQATAVPPSQPTSPPSPPLAVSDTINKLRKTLGAIPASIFRPVIGMVVIIGLGLLVSFFCGSWVVFFLSFLHNAGAVVCIILAAGQQKFLYAPLAALLTMTVWGWYCFTAVPTAISILGLLAGIAVSTWAMFEFFRPETRRHFTDPSLPYRLELLPIPALIGIGGGGPLVLILGVGLVLWLTTGSRTGGGSEDKIDVPDFSKVDYSLDTSKLDYKQGPKGEKLITERRDGPDGPEFITGYKDEKGDFIEHGLATGKYRDGSRRFEMEVYAGKEHGKSTEWYPNGQISKQGLMKEGETHGKWIEFYEDGNKKSESYSLSGKAHGPYIEWFRDGKKKTELTYVNGEKHGVHTEWYENGQKAASTPNVNGKLHGTLITWDEKGKEIVRIRFRQGQLDFKPASEKREMFSRVIEVLKAGEAIDKLEDWMQALGKPDSGYNEAAIPTRSDQPAARQVWVYNCRDGKKELQVRIIVGGTRSGIINRSGAGVILVIIDQMRDL